MAIVYEKQKITLGFKKDKPEVYRIKPVRQQPVTFDDLLNEVSNSCGVNRSQTKAVLEALIDRMIVFMNYGMPVKLGDFGSFKPTFNAKTGATADDVTAENVTERKSFSIPASVSSRCLKECLSPRWKITMKRRQPDRNLNRVEELSREEQTLTREVADLHKIFQSSFFC
jgi:nucleoid DNA-binding protein